MKEANGYPNLFIVGAPKSGTTSLYNWLGSHSNIFMPELKEPAYLCGFDTKFSGPGSDQYNDMVVWDESTYKSLFKGASDVRYVGEASTDYLLCGRAPQTIYQYSPNAKIIVILRDPARRAFSEHMHLVRNGIEDKSFSEALKCEQERIKKGWIPLFYHVERSKYNRGIQEYTNYFKPRNIKIILFSELKRDADKVYHNVLEFLGLQYEPAETGRKYQATGEVRSRCLFNLLNWLSANKVVNRTVKFIANEKWARDKRLQFRNKLLKKKSIRQEDRKLVLQKIESNIDKVNQLIRQDVSSWKKV